MVRPGRRLGLLAALHLASLTPSLVAQAGDRPPGLPTERLALLERQRDDLLSQQTRVFTALERQLTGLAQPVGRANSLAELAAALRRDSARVALLEEAARRRVEARFDLQTLRYHTGVEVLRVLFHSAEKLDYATGLAASLTALDAAANPLNSPAFRTELAAVTAGREREGGGFTLPDLLLRNPVVSAALSVASLVSSSLGRKDKEQAFARIGCVLDFTSRASRDAGDLRRDLEEIDSRVKVFLADAEGVFASYAATVGPPQTWAAFRSELAATVGTPQLTRSIDDYFGARKSEAVRRAWTVASVDDLVETNYQLDLVKSLLSRHEQLTLDTSRFLARFEAVVRRYEAVQCEAIPRLGETVAGLIQRAAENQARFRTGWADVISAKSRALLYANP